MRLDELFEFILAKKIVGNLPAERVIRKVTQDTREVETGDVFVCLKGTNFDGHALAEEAAAKGAEVVVAEKALPAIEAQGIPVVYVKDTHKIMAVLAKAAYSDLGQGMQLIGVTGTNGKTTVTHMIEAIFQQLQTKSDARTSHPGDTVLITGRGHETTYQVGREELLLIDAEEAKRAIAARGDSRPAGAIEVI